MNHDDRDELWDLLGRAKEPEVSPFFASHILRAIREEPKSSAAWWEPLLRRWQWAGAGAALSLALLAGLGSWHQAQQHEQITRLAQEVSSSPDYAVIGHLDELLAYEENSVWLEKPAY